MIEFSSSFAFLYPDISEEWDYVQNAPLQPSMVTPKSGRNVWWICVKGHHWQARIADRTDLHGCPFCAGRRAIPGETDLQTQYPDLMLEWDYERNDHLDPSKIKGGSHLKAFWKCHQGHSWVSTIKNRVNGSGCPYCSGALPIIGKTDLSASFPQLCKEWHPTKNGKLTPHMVTRYSNKKVWWIGICGHEWQDTVTHRTQGRGCPECNLRNRTSFPEQAIYFYLKKTYPDAINRYTDLFTNGMELDIFIPELKIGIEYDGLAWHNTEAAKKREMEKYILCQENSIRLIRVKETRSDFDSAVSDVLLYTFSDLSDTIRQLQSFLILPDDIDVDRDRQIIQESYYKALRSKSLMTMYPQIAAEWHPSKNGILTADMFPMKSGEVVWWKGSCGHEWTARISERTVHNDGCPYCSNHRLLSGFNDLQTRNPSLALEWHPSKNEPITPSTIIASSTTRVWWRCGKGHEWQAQLNYRTRGNNCPYCSNKKVLTGYNDFASANPDLMSEWDWDENRNINPSEIMSGSKVSVWWVCKTCHHKWQAVVANRSNGSGCPICSQKRRTEKYQVAMVKKTGSLSQMAPNLLTEWDYQRNSPASPETVPSGSTKKFWWVCHQCSHIWLMSVYSRIHNKAGCPRCSTAARLTQGLQTKLTKYGSFADVHPELSLEWHPFLNGDMKPTDFLPNSRKEVWWKGRCEHEWTAKIAERSAGSHCPYCSSRRLLKGFNDLATRNPQLISEWDNERNNDLSPDMVMMNSTRKVWWRCPKGHEWQATVANRSKGSGCPICSGYTVVAGVNDLATTNPETLANWDYTNNLTILPSKISNHSRKVVSFICHYCHHQWNESVFTYIARNTCPHCNK